MRFLEKMAAKFLKSRMKSFVVCLVEDPYKKPAGWIYGDGWWIVFGE